MMQNIWISYMCKYIMIIICIVLTDNWFGSGEKLFFSEETRFSLYKNNSKNWIREVTILSISVWYILETFWNININTVINFVYIVYVLYKEYHIMCYYMLWLQVGRRRASVAVLPRPLVLPSPIVKTINITDDLVNIIPIIDHVYTYTLHATQKRANNFSTRYFN